MSFVQIHNEMTKLGPQRFPGAQQLEAPGSLFRGGSLQGAGGIGGLLARSHDYGSGNWSSHSYYHADGNGNVTYLETSAQGEAASYRYDPFGNVVSKSGALADANVYRFSTKELHVKSGLIYYLYRFYSPNWQRWANRDPSGEQGFMLLV